MPRPRSARGLALWLLPAVLAAPMLLVAELTGRHELLFPEGIALAFGVWALQRPELTASRVQLVLLPTLCGAVGVGVVWLALPRWLGCLVALTVALALLQAARCQVGPALSAAVLPVVFDVHGWMYLLAVVAICGVVAMLPDPAGGQTGHAGRCWDWGRTGSSPRAGSCSESPCSTCRQWRSRRLCWSHALSG